MKLLLKSSNEWPKYHLRRGFSFVNIFRSPFVVIRGNFRPDSLPNVVQMQYCGCSAVPSWLPSHNPPIYGCLEAAPEWGLENREIYEIGQLLFHRAVPKHQLRLDISHFRFNLLVKMEGNYKISATESPGLPPLWRSLTEIWIFSWLGPTESTEPALRGQLGNWIGKGAAITATRAEKQITAIREGPGYQIGWILKKALLNPYNIWPSYLLAYMQPYLS